MCGARGRRQRTIGGGGGGAVRCGWTMGDAWLWAAASGLESTPTPSDLVTSKSVALVSVSDYPGVVGVGGLAAEAPRDPLAALPQSPVSQEDDVRVGANNDAVGGGERLAAVDANANVADEKEADGDGDGDGEEHDGCEGGALTGAGAGAGVTCVAQDRCGLGRVAAGGALRAPLDVLVSLGRAAGRAAVGGSAMRAALAWRAQRRVAPARGAVTALLCDGGMRLERRRRLGARVAPELKASVRAQRNRERSQALRRHHKRRLALLHGATLALERHCRALRRLAAAMVHMHKGTPPLRDALVNALAFADSDLCAFVGEEPDLVA